MLNIEDHDCHHCSHINANIDSSNAWPASYLWNVVERVLAGCLCPRGTIQASSYAYTTSSGRNSSTERGFGVLNVYYTLN